MPQPTEPEPINSDAVEIRVRGLVQGVGFRPAVWRWARELTLLGEVLNDGAGLLIRAAGSTASLSVLRRRLEDEAPRLARVEAVAVSPWQPAVLPHDFRIAGSTAGAVRTSVPADVTTCESCRAEVLNRSDRRYGYALTNCTNCGPRLSIISGLPYDRARTSMAAYGMCADCRAEYEDPTNRRFHAEPIACPVCGPQVQLVELAGSGHSASGSGAIAAAARLLRTGHCIAVKGLGGYQLACDAMNAGAVQRLRSTKRRPAKPFALMARDLDIVGRYARFCEAEAAALRSHAAPIVLLDARPARLPENIAPGLATVGFMLPATPLHILLLDGIDVPLVMTSGNVADEPQIIDDTEAVSRLGGLASHVLAHERAIAMRLDDSVVHVSAGRPRLLRRARGYAPAGIPLPQGFERAPAVLATGAELKAAFCMLKDGAAILSPHLGDLDEAAALEAYRDAIARFGALLDFAPAVVACDLHPDYGSTRAGEEIAARHGLSVERVQHHHAHIASCLAENGWPLDAGPVLGIALDGAGLGDDGTIWGGEFLLADYRNSRRIGRLRPIPLPGGDRAASEPWRCLYAHLVSALGWPLVSRRYARLSAVQALGEKPLAMLDRMMASGLNTPLASSCGRLFDAVAAACQLAFERNRFEGEAAMRLESAAALHLRASDRSAGYPFAIHRAAHGDMIEIDPAPMWEQLLEDLAAAASPQQVAGRFHKGLARALAEAVDTATASREAATRPIDTIALSGGVLHNRCLSEALVSSLRDRDFVVLTQAQVPAGDGGLSLGQALIAAARTIPREE